MVLINVFENVHIAIKVIYPVDQVLSLLYTFFRFGIYVFVVLKARINLLKPTGHVMHQQLNIQQFYFLRTNSDLCHLQHKLIGFYNWDEKCLLRGTNWVFK